MARLNGVAHGLRGPFKRLVSRLVVRARRVVVDARSRISSLLAARRTRPPGPSSSPVANARTVSGRFPRSAGSREVLKRCDGQGWVTNYQVYGPDGLPIKRVDVVGRPHGGVDTPHVVDYQRHVDPSTGRVFVRPAPTVRPASREELTGLG